MTLSWLPSTTEGRIVGDYISTSIAGGTGHGVFEVAVAPSGNVFNEATYTPATGLAAAFAPNTSTLTPSGLDQPVPNAASDHPASTAPLTSR